MSLSKVNALDTCDALFLGPMSSVCSILPGFGVYIGGIFVVVCPGSFGECSTGPRLESQL